MRLNFQNIILNLNLPTFFKTNFVSDVEIGVYIKTR